MRGIAGKPAAVETVRASVIVCPERTTQERWLETRQCLQQFHGIEVLESADIKQTWQQAANDILIFLDPACEPDRNFLKATLDFFQQNPDADLVAGRILPLWKARKPAWMKKEQFPFLRLTDGDSAAKLGAKDLMHEGNFALRRERFVPTQDPTTLAGLKRLAAQAKSIHYNPAAIVYRPIDRSDFNEATIVGYWIEKQTADLILALEEAQQPATDKLWAALDAARTKDSRNDDTYHVLRQAIDRHTADKKPMALEETGLAARDMGINRIAVDCLTDCANQFPSYIQGLLSLSEFCMTVGETATAQEVLNRAVRADPGHHLIQCRHGDQLLQQGDVPKAEQAFQNALARNPNDYFSLIKLAAIFARTNRELDAMQLARKAAIIKPESGEPWQLLTELTLQLGQTAEFQECFTELRQRNPDYKKIKPWLEEYERLQGRETTAPAAASPSSTAPIPTTRTGERSSSGSSRTKARYLFTPSNEVHVEWMLPIARQLEGSEFMIIAERGENADVFLERTGTPFHTYEAGLLEALKPDVVIVGNDWCQEGMEILDEARGLGIPSVCIQEGPLNFHDPAMGPRMMYADHAFVQGEGMLRYLQRKTDYAVTGNPKYDGLKPCPLPAKPTVMINSNFSYGVFTEVRDRWVKAAVDACRTLGLDYFISQHPRDFGVYPASWNVRPSNADVVGGQLREASILISRFSTVIYEAVMLGREVVYYNPHREPFRIFSEDDTGGLFVEETEEGLQQALLRAVSVLGTERPERRRFLEEHCATVDGDSAKRCADALRKIVGEASVQEAPQLEAAVSEPGISFCIITNNKKPEKLQRCLESLRAQKAGAMEIIVAGEYREEEGIVYVPASAGAESGRLGGMRNRAVARARYDRIVMLDDDMILAPDWSEQLQAFGDDYDIMTSRIRLPDGTRYWDHAAFIPPDVQKLLNFTEQSDGIYMSGGTAWVMKSSVARAMGWNEKLGFNEAEDVEFSRRCREAGYRIRHNPRCVAYHNDPSYTRLGSTVLQRSPGHDHLWLLGREDLKSPDRLMALGQNEGKEGYLAEFADCLRAGMILYPADPRFVSGWQAFLDSAGGDVEGDRWYLEGDPYYRMLIGDKPCSQEELESAAAVMEEWLREQKKPNSCTPALRYLLQLQIESMRNQCDTEAVELLENFEILLGQKPVAAAAP